MDWKQAVMIFNRLRVLLYLGIVKKIRAAASCRHSLRHAADKPARHGHLPPEMWFDNSKPDYMDVLQNGGLLDILYIGVKTSVYPCLIFLGWGAMTDFGPLLANPKSMLLGRRRSSGIYCAFLIAVCFFTGVSPAIAISAAPRTYGYLRNQSAGAPPARTDCGRGLFLHGADSFDSASADEDAHHQKGKADSHGAAQKRFQGSKIIFPHYGDNHHRALLPSVGSTARLPHARQPV